MKPITDKAEIAVEFPEKAYVGSFSRHSQYAVTVDSEGVILKLVHPGEDRRTADLNLHYYLFADILGDLARALSQMPTALDESHRAPLRDAVRHLGAVLCRHVPTAAK